MKSVLLIVVSFFIAHFCSAQVSPSGCFISGAIVNPGSIAGCGNSPAYCNLASLYVPAFTPSACGTAVVGGGVSHAKLTSYILPAGCTATVEAEFRKRNNLGVGSSTAGCSNSGMDGADEFHIFQSGGILVSQGSTINVNVGTCGLYPGLGTYTTAVASLSAGCSNADGYLRMVLTGGSFSVQGESDRADEIITFTVNISGTCGPSCSSVLPVELTSFNAEAQDHEIILKWHAATETNTNEYILEKSVDALEWKKMGSIQTNKSNYRNVFYSFTDDFPFRGENYFRLSSVDYEGQVNVEGITSVTYLNSDHNFEISQTDTEIILRCNSAFIGKTVTFYEATGKLLQKSKIPTSGNLILQKSVFQKGLLILSCEELPQTGRTKVLVY